MFVYPGEIVLGGQGSREVGARQFAAPLTAIVEGDADLGGSGIRQRLLGRAGHLHQATHLVMSGVIPDTGLLHDPAGNGTIEVITAQRRVPGGRHHLEHTPVQPQEISNVPPPRS